MRLVRVLTCSAIAWTAATPAQAFTTRIHIAIANDLREALIASDDGTLPLQVSGHAVQLSPEDAEAIIDHPLEFRAGAIGPDNFIFPAMTDPTHAIGLGPFDQCELLYDAAILPEEKAYAMGCFVHGASDAVAHHYVNWLTGETFTLNPMSQNREFHYDNVVRHIVAEAMIQQAALAQDPGVFEAGQLQHSLPVSFVLRTYLDTDSEIWQAMTHHARPKLDTAKANHGDDLLLALQDAELAPAEQLSLLPVYLAEVDLLLSELESWLQAQLADLQDPSTPNGATLAIGAGGDGVVGTLDDTTDCSLSCPTLYGQYFTGVGLLMPRENAAGDPLPSAFDKLVEELRLELFQFLPAYVSSIALISAELNAPISDTDGAATLNIEDLQAALAPMNDWLTDVTQIDYDTAIASAFPDWVLDIESVLSLVPGLSLDTLVRSLFQPYIDIVHDAIEDYVLGVAEPYLEDLEAEIAAKEAEIEDEFTAALDSAAPEGTTGNVLDHFFESGLYTNAFNLSATALANHAAVLPLDDDRFGGVGPASFDASHTASWSQVAACDYLTEAVFPMGHDLQGVLSVHAGEIQVGRPASDAPAECHDGSVSSFTDAADAVSCALTDLETLLDDPVGSLSRAYSPATVGLEVPCEGLVVAGLPEPPDVPGTDDPSETDGSSEAKGCGCNTTPTPAGWGLLALVGLIALRRRRWAATAALIALTGCGPGEDTDVAADTEVADSDTDSDGTTDTDEGPSPRAQLIATLGDSTWRGTAERDGVERQIEQHFRADSLLWGELVNPWGPARSRHMRILDIDDDGLNITSVVTYPAGWEIGSDNGDVAQWTIEVIDGSPRTLRLVHDGITETYEEGSWEAPTSGLTAVARVFPSGGATDQAFCDSGFSGITYPTVFAFARGTGEDPAATDAVAGAALMRWSEPANSNTFSVSDVSGFDAHGGTEVVDTLNFMVTYTGQIVHPGGELSLRERDDVVEDAVWAFVGPDAGSGNSGDLFLEVHGFAWPDSTSDAPSVNLSAGTYDVEIVVVRCELAISNVDVEIEQGAGWQLVGEVDTIPALDEDLFPSVF